MNTFIYPFSGVYTARTRNRDGSFHIHRVPVEVLGETGRSYSVRLLFPTPTHKLFDTIVVRKHNVRLDTSASQYDYTEAFWNQ